MVDLAKLGRNVEKTIEQISKLAKDIVPKSPSTKVVEGTWSKPALKDFTSKSWEKLTSKEKGTIAQHYGYSPKIPPENFTDLKLPHHRPSDGAAVGNGLRNALARLPQTKGIPDDEKARIESHLNGHLNKLKKKEDSTSKQSEIEKESSEQEEHTKVAEEHPEEPDEDDDNEEDNMKDGVFTIAIDGVIGWDITAESVKDQLAKADGVDVVFEIASPGGSVYEGIEIFNAIRNYKGDTTAKLMGMAASMASYIPLATDRVLAEDNAVFMIHNAWTMAIGDSEELKAESEILESINETIAQAYVAKTGKKEKEVLQMMSDETWMFGDEIKKEGFADAMIDHSKDEKKGRGADAQASKEVTLADAKVKVKDMFLKLHKDRMKEDFDKIKQKGNGGVSKMEDKKEYVSKFDDENIEGVKGVIGKLNELAKAKEIKGDDLINIAQELEGLIIVTKSNKPAHQEEAKKVEANDEEVNAEEKEAEAAKKEEDAKKEAEDKKEDPKGNDEKKKDDKGEEAKDEGADEGKEDDKDKKEGDDNGEEASKQSEIEKGYKQVAGEAISKMEEVNKLYKLEQDKNETLTSANIKLTEKISKFKEEAHKVLVDDVVDEICKFGELDDQNKIKKVDELSKMSDEALDVMKAEFVKVNVSKMENEEENTTEPSQNLEGKEKGEEDSVSKMEEEVKEAVNRQFKK